MKNSLLSLVLASTLTSFLVPLSAEISSLSFFTSSAISTSSSELHSTPSLEQFYACPRCRRAAPKGPRKLPVQPEGNLWV